MKALRAILNKAIQEKEASASTYPFSKGGFISHRSKKKPLNAIYQWIV
ncbi:MAG: hypothetical protein LBS54_07875 [Dysgonamonadaceae bacterium]|nr:hypothetical protein [Dysgonamonadaceae bacterium]